MRIGKEFKFEAAHFLEGHSKCGKMHGHTYHVWVEVEGLIELKSGMVMDLHTLSDIVRTVTEELDHVCLNEELNIERTTCENLSLYIYNSIYERILAEGCELKSVKVQEGEGGYAICER